MLCSSYPLFVPQFGLLVVSLVLRELGLLDAAMYCKFETSLHATWSSLDDRHRNQMS